MDDPQTARPPAHLFPKALLDPRPPVLAVRFGRGRTGGSTLLDLLIQLCRQAGREVIIGDGDRGNATLAGLYPPGTESGATQPHSSEIPDVKDWITELVGQGLAQRRSVMLDLGGGDRVMEEYGRDLDLVAACERAGMMPLGLFFAGPEGDDFEHVLKIWRSGYFRPHRSILIFNEHLVPQGRTSLGAFDSILARPGAKEIADQGMKAVFMARLPCLDHVRQSGLSLFAAASNLPGRNGKPLEPLRQFMVEDWITKIIGEFDRIGALTWLP
jgi:hypothetical protein